MGKGACVNKVGNSSSIAYELPIPPSAPSLLTFYISASFIIRVIEPSMNSHQHIVNIVFTFAIIKKGGDPISKILEANVITRLLS
jgi:hypothetical protein